LKWILTIGIKSRTPVPEDALGKLSVISLCQALSGSLRRCGEDNCLFSILAKHIQILETRFTRRPEVLDDESVLILHRNLFLVGLFSLAKEEICEDAPGLFELAVIIQEVMSKLTGNQLESTMPLEEFKVLVASRVAIYEDDGGNGFLLLRHTTLFAHFMLGCSLRRTATWWTGTRFWTRTISRTFTEWSLRSRMKCRRWLRSICRTIGRSWGSRRRTTTS
jgi:hypothetical protein